VNLVGRDAARDDPVSVADRRLHRRAGDQAPVEDLREHRDGHRARQRDDDAGDQSQQVE
jgi:hypothetical protein